jgi:hypothetical protein
MNKFSDQKKAAAGASKDDSDHKKKMNSTPSPKQDVAGKAAMKEHSDDGHKDHASKTSTEMASNITKSDGKPDAFKTKWKSKINAAKDNWGKLSASELLKSDGDAKVLADLVHLRYAISMVDANKQVKQFLDKCHC